MNTWIIIIINVESLSSIKVYIKTSYNIRQKASASNWLIIMWGITGVPCIRDKPNLTIRKLFDKFIFWKKILYIYNF